MHFAFVVGKVACNGETSAVRIFFLWTIVGIYAKVNGLFAFG